MPGQLCPCRLAGQSRGLWERKHRPSHQTPLPWPPALASFSSSQPGTTGQIREVLGTSPWAGRTLMWRLSLREVQ